MDRAKHIDSKERGCQPLRKLVGPLPLWAPLLSTGPRSTVGPLVEPLAGVAPAPPRVLIGVSSKGMVFSLLKQDESCPYLKLLYYSDFVNVFSGINPRFHFKEASMIDNFCVVGYTFGCPTFCKIFKAFHGQTASSQDG